MREFGEFVYEKVLQIKRKKLDAPMVLQPRATNILTASNTSVAPVTSVRPVISVIPIASVAPVSQANQPNQPPLPHLKEN